MTKTTEEAAEHEYPKCHGDIAQSEINGPCRDAFIKGANWQAGRSVTAQVELSESQWAVLSNRMVEEHRKYGNHLRGGHWAEIAARRVVSHMRDFGCLAAPLSPEMVEKMVEEFLGWMSDEFDTQGLRADESPGHELAHQRLRTRLLAIR